MVAGPPGGGKSTLFPASEFGVDYFNADDVAATLNGGSYLNISPETRRQVNRQFELFIDEHIRDGKSFAIETTLRTVITFEQAQRARAKGFFLVMYYVTVQSAREAMKRVAIRADAGGHSAPKKFLTHTYRCSMGNLPIAISQFDRVFVFDNSAFNARPQAVIRGIDGGIDIMGTPTPLWVQHVVEAVARRLNKSPFAPLAAYKLYATEPTLRAIQKLPLRIRVAAFAAIRRLERNPHANERQIGSLYFSAYGAQYRVAYRVDESRNSVTLQLIERLHPLFGS